MHISPSQRFRLLLDLGKRIIFLVDGTLARIAKAGSWWAPHRSTVATPQAGAAMTILSGDRTLEGWFVAPANPPRAALLLLHGIGDRIAYWRAAQHRLAASGITSLIFHYAGYGASQGQTIPEHLEPDVHAAYATLRSLIPAPTPLYVLGFSLGSGLAAQVASSLQPPPSGIILAEAFPTLRLAAKRVVRGIPFIANLFPDVWKTRQNVARLTIPLLIIHSTGDTLFPIAMAEDIYAAARAGGAPADLAVFHGYRHNAPYLSVPEDYWSAIVDFISRTSSPATSPDASKLESSHGTYRNQ
jgi:alpha-beta hydrolase superfamily lysophospholipase